MLGVSFLKRILFLMNYVFSSCKSVWKSQELFLGISLNHQLLGFFNALRLGKKKKLSNVGNFKYHATKI